MIEASAFFLFAALTLTLWLIIGVIAPPMWRFGEHFWRRIARAVMESERFAWLGSRRDRIGNAATYAPVILVLVLGALITLWAGENFLDLVELLRQSSPEMEKVDQRSHSVAASLRNDATTVFFKVAADIGSPIALGIMVLVATVLLAKEGRYRWIGYLLLTAIGGGVLNLLLKEMFQRARPDLSVALRNAHGFSFPSGHAMGSIIVFSALAYLAVRAFTEWKSRSFAIALATAATLAVGASRVYLGVHWTSDIGAGWCAGLLWFATTTTAYELFRHLFHLRAAKRNRRAES